MRSIVDIKKTILIAGGGTGSAVSGYAAPTAGINEAAVVCEVNMGNSADLVLSLKTATAAAGTGAADFAADVLIFVDGKYVGVGKSHTVSYVADGNNKHIVEFLIQPGLLKGVAYVGISAGASNAANTLAAQLAEDTYYKPVAR